MLATGTCCLSSLPFARWGVCVCVLALFASPLLDLPPFDFRRSERKRARTPLSLSLATSLALPSPLVSLKIFDSRSTEWEMHEGRGGVQARHLGERRKTRNMHERIKRKIKTRTGKVGEWKPSAPRRVFHLCGFPMACDPVLRLPTVPEKEQRDYAVLWRKKKRKSTELLVARVFLSLPVLFLSNFRFLTLFLSCLAFIPFPVSLVPRFPLPSRSTTPRVS